MGREGKRHPVTVEIFTLCDFASVDPAGKLNIIGTFDRINAETVPHVHGVVGMAIRIQFAPEETGRQKIQVEAKHPDGTLFIPLIEADMEGSTGDELTGKGQMTGIFTGVRFPVFGKYSFYLQREGRTVAELGLHVVKTESQTTNAP